MFNRILLVCTGNICRSPMAEALLRERLKGSGHEVRSAGTAALLGHPADPMAIEVAARAGLDIREHRARQLSRAMLSSADLVLAMDRSHVAWVTERFPEMRGRVKKLGHWRNNLDIRDPYRMSAEVFAEVFGRIQECTAEWIPRIHA